MSNETRLILLARKHGILFRHTPINTTEMYCYQRDLEKFAQELMADCADLCATQARAIDNGNNEYVRYPDMDKCADLIRAEIPRILGGK